MRSLSHAIEDECLACAERPIVAGGFQSVRAYRRAEPRWRELARTSRLTFVLAGFRRRRAPAHGPLEVPVAPDEPARREWVVVCLDNRYTACLAGWELPDTGERRRFEVAWTTEPAAVMTTMKRAVALAGLATPGERGGQALAAFAEPPPANADMTLRLSNRMIGYLATSAGER